MDITRNVQNRRKAHVNESYTEGEKQGSRPITAKLDTFQSGWFGPDTPNHDEGAPSLFGAGDRHRLQLLETNHDGRRLPVLTRTALESSSWSIHSLSLERRNTQLLPFFVAGTSPARAMISRVL